jgi:hypothetical protein
MVEAASICTARLRRSWPWSSAGGPKHGRSFVEEAARIEDPDELSPHVDFTTPNSAIQEIKHRGNKQYWNDPFMAVGQPARKASLCRPTAWTGRESR